MEKLKTALYFGADAVYFSGKNFGLRAFAGNFNDEEMKEAVLLCHKQNKKAYVTVNIVAHNSDFEGLETYAKFLQEINVDGVIISDLGVMEVFKKYAPKVDIHISTQANVTNKYAAKFLVEQGAKRIVLARELNLEEIKEIRDFLPKEVELEAFVHGAMCISYSGRCLLSNYLCGRDGNRGECVQACRWGYTINEVSRKKQKLPIEEDERGTYILNSYDLKMINHIDKLARAGVTSFKIEGRMKSPYYTANIVNAYRRAIDLYYKNKEDFLLSKELDEECYKSSNRGYETGFYFKNLSENNQNLESSTPHQTYDFVAVVVGNKSGQIEIEMRNRFKVGDTLQILSPNEYFNKEIKILNLYDKNGLEIKDAKNVQEHLFFKSDINFAPGDILRKKL